MQYRTQDLRIMSLLCYHIGCYEGIIIKNTYHHHFTKVRTSKAIILEASGPLDRSSDDCCGTKSSCCVALVTDSDFVSHLHHILCNWQ
jgi:hypothetical protein